MVSQNLKPQTPDLKITNKLLLLLNETENKNHIVRYKNYTPCTKEYTKFYILNY